jgi:hypothetical protein
MEKNDLIELLNQIFIPLGFKTISNNWVLNGTELAKIINLQKLLSIFLLPGKSWLETFKIVSIC